MSGNLRHFFDFDDFRIDVEERRLLRDGQTVAVTSVDFDVLVKLVENHGKTVSKNYLMDTVWPETFVEEGNLNRHISTLRRQLGDDPKAQRLIKTIPKRGYRFTSAVKEIVERSETFEVDSVSRSKITIQKETSEGFWTTSRSMLSTLLVLAVAGVGWFGLSSTFRGGRAAESSTEEARAEASELVTRGRELWRTREANDLYNATSMFERAAALDPELALAHAALADAYAFDYSNWKKAEAEARRAIELKPSMGEPHAAIGFVRMFWEWRLADAETDFKHAISLNPEYATARQWYAVNLAVLGRGDAALVEIERASAVEPLSVPIITDKCRILYFVEKYDAAEAACRSVLDLAPHSLEARELLFQLAMTTRRYSDAAKLFAETASLSKSDRIREEGPRVARAIETGGTDAFKAALLDFYINADTSFYKQARILAEMGQHERAVANLNEAVAVRDFDMVYYAGDPAFRRVRAGSTRHIIPGRPE